jgi:UDP-N-acetylmuramate dehydrogenase
MEQELTKRFGEQVKLEEPMGRHTNFRIGGPARFFVEAKSLEDVKDAVAMAKRHGIDYVVLGGGSNMLVSDKGYGGLVIKIALRGFAIEGERVEAEAGALAVAVARASVDAGLAGFEWAISLPGTIGGAVRGNAGCFGGETKDVIQSVKVLRGGEVVEFTNEELEFGYRESLIKHGKDIILSVVLDLKPGNTEKLKERMVAILTKRRESQPMNKSSAGCMFKNYEIKSEEELVSLDKELGLLDGMKEKKQVSCGWLIDKLGMKGMTIGGAKISEQHGNFLMNLGDATAQDVVQLIQTVKDLVEEKTGIVLHEEVQYVGFE